MKLVLQPRQCKGKNVISDGRWEDQGENLTKSGTRKAKSVTEPGLGSTGTWKLELNTG